MSGLSPQDQDRLDGIPLSVVGRHQERCCRDAWQLVLRDLNRYPDIGSRMAAVPILLPWGPVRWPLHWCEVMSAEKLEGDCGVHADLASAILTSAGVAHERGRVAIAASTWATAHWRSAWVQRDGDPRWIGREAVHHEVLRIGDRWWDPTDACWFAGPGAALLSGRVVAARTESGPWLMSVS